jgi:hypothetical protein
LAQSRTIVHDRGIINPKESINSLKAGIHVQESMGTEDSNSYSSGDEKVDSSFNRTSQVEEELLDRIGEGKEGESSTVRANDVSGAAAYSILHHNSALVKANSIDSPKSRRNSAFSSYVAREFLNRNNGSKDKKKRSQSVVGNIKGKKAAREMLNASAPAALEDRTPSPNRDSPLSRGDLKALIMQDILHGVNTAKDSDKSRGRPSLPKYNSAGEGRLIPKGLMSEEKNATPPSDRRTSSLKLTIVTDLGSMDLKERGGEKGAEKKKEVAMVKDSGIASLPSTSSGLVEKPREHWASDLERVMCSKCCSTFTFLNRRHHCRFCGEIFCASCTSIISLPVSPSAHEKKGFISSLLSPTNSKYRVCHSCCRRLPKEGK